MKKEVNPLYKRIITNPGDKTYSNFDTSSVGAGATAGAALGSVVPVIGTVAGGIIGGATALVSSIFGGKKKPDPADPALIQKIIQARQVLITNPTATLQDYYDLNTGIEQNWEPIVQASIKNGAPRPSDLQFYNGTGGQGVKAATKLSDVYFFDYNGTKQYVPVLSAKITTTAGGDLHPQTSPVTAVTYDAKGNPIPITKDKTTIYIIVAVSGIIIIALAIYLSRKS
jgi:hypothetical protein